jgi:hypothetical protein
MKCISPAWCLGMLLLGFLCAPPAHAQHAHSHTFHASGANFRRSLAELVFSPEGLLYAAYRLPGHDHVSSVLRVLALDPVSRKEVMRGDYAVPETLGPRVPTHFMLSQDSSMLAYAELHSPQVLLTLDASTLALMSSSERNLFQSRVFAPHIKAFDRQSLVLTAEKLGGHPNIVRNIWDITLASADLRRVVSENTIPPEVSLGDIQYWSHLTHKELNYVLAADDRTLGFTNLTREGLIYLFDEQGNTVTNFYSNECGFTRASITADRQFAVAVCERIDLNKQHPSEVVLRKAVVFEVETLKTVDSFLISCSGVEERAPQGEDVWVAIPAPVIWHGGDKLVVAYPEFPDSIKTHTILLKNGSSLSTASGPQ